MHNLDTLAAETAQQIIRETQTAKASDVENLATKTLGVLQENGVYAATLYLYSRSSDDDKQVGQTIRQALLGETPHLLPGTSVPQDTAEIALEFVTTHIADDLDHLLLVKQLWEQTLIYVRYGAKARG